MAAAAAGAAPIVSSNNRIETQKLYMTLLQFSLYDNPSRQYSRKIKLKRVYPSVSSGPGGGSSTGTIEYVIASPQQLHIVPASSIKNEGVKTRKKMKITSSINESGQFDIPKLPTPVEDETPTNIIILKPSEYEKITYSKYSLTELRSLCSHYNIKKSGTKTDLIQRIYTFLKQTYFIRRIQRNFKDFLSKKYRKLSGPGYLQTTKCVNDTDF